MFKNVIKKYGRGYYRATFLFSREIREATWAYYAFIRAADEIVDGEGVTNRAQKLNEWKNEWISVAQNNTVSQNSSFNSYKQIMQDYGIPAEYTLSFLEAMERDLSVTRYATYSELEHYMYGTAVVVGYTMSYIIGFSDSALPHARALGEAFQLTNFLRDIREDYELRGRIYLPQEDMDRFGVTEQHISIHTVDENWQALMKFEIQRTRELYEKGVAGIHLLHPKGRRAVYAAALVYKEILDEIEKNNYDIFSKRIVVSKFRKTMLLCKALWKRNL
jgi:phytoene synthase